ncbi:hypothetical protein GCM10010964_42200 [Caldovatus sediminis]|uniref:Uncharacterized protein n=1 Tax=Caldovatus sediminis TaxID=2041189 RepID=A0A8J3EE86_9PROT|nr:hypothetical protein [Caldovatus sediminis]GGG50466.1 hypothetical protein GCM10010964_42200 [Caldovatus sediminis]
MAGKRKAKRATMRHEDLSKPSKWRLQHGGFEEGVRGTDPDTGCPVQHRRAVDSLGVLLANGSITPQMHEAGVVFRTLFQRAALDRVRTMPLIRIPGGSPDLLTESQSVARERVVQAIDALGGFGSPSGSVAWYVVGLEHSIRDWSLRQGWNARPMNPAHAQGALVGALGVLSVHFGLVRRSRAAASATPFLMLPAFEEKSARA